MDQKLTVVIVAFSSKILQEVEDELMRYNLLRRVRIIFTYTSGITVLEDMADICFIGPDQKMMWTLSKGGGLFGTLTRVALDSYDIILPGSYATPTLKAAHRIVDLCRIKLGVV